MSSTKEVFRIYLASEYRARMSFQSYLTTSQQQHEEARRALGWPLKGK